MNKDRLELRYPESAIEKAHCLTTQTAETSLGCPFEVTANLVKDKCSLERQLAMCKDDEASFRLEHRDLKETSKDSISKDDSIDEHKDQWKEQLELAEENYFGDVSCCTSLNMNEDSDQLIHNQQPSEQACSVLHIPKDEDLFESYFGDVSRNNSMSTCASELQATRADSTSSRILVGHFTRSASSRYLNKKTSSRMLLPMTSIDSEHPVSCVLVQYTFIFL